MATHSSVLALRIPWTEESGRLQSMGSQRVRHDWGTKPPGKKYSEWEFVRCSLVIPTLCPEEEGVLQGRGLHRTPMTSVSRSLSPGGPPSPPTPRPLLRSATKGSIVWASLCLRGSRGLSRCQSVCVCVWGHVHSCRNVCLCVYILVYANIRLPRWLSGKEPACQWRRLRFNPWVRKVPWRKEWLPLQYSCLEDPMDGGAWRAIVHSVTKSQTRLSN